MNIKGLSKIGIVSMILVFEFSNFSATRYGLDDMLQGMSPLFGLVSWPFIFAAAFSVVDFVGLGAKPRLFGPWFIMASLNAIMIWWGVTLAILRSVQMPLELVGILPVVVFIVVWVVRVPVVGIFAETISSEE